MMEFSLTTLPDNPILLVCSKIKGKNSEFGFPRIYVVPNEWGKSSFAQVLDPQFCYPSQIELLFYSPSQRCSFYFKSNSITKFDDDFQKYMIGIIGDGMVILYGLTFDKCVEIHRWKAIKDEKLNRYSNFLESYIEKEREQQKSVSISNFDLYNYRFNVDVGKQELLTQKLKVFFADSTFNRNAGEYLKKYSLISIPSKISFEYSNDRCQYSINFFLNLHSIVSIFHHFYGAHPETKTDFIIRIDAENKKYELALYRQGLKEPVVIPESAYQLIVFKNKFEDYRSENYDQPRGAWIW